jgi:hypothetical protein
MRTEAVMALVKAVSNSFPGRARQNHRTSPFANIPADCGTRRALEHEAGVKTMIVLNRLRLLTVDCIPLSISTICNFWHCFSVTKWLSNRIRHAITCLTTLVNGVWVSYHIFPATFFFAGTKRTNTCNSNLILTLRWYTWSYMPKCGQLY